ncbi:uncharacterized protein UHOD_12035 [Ustilago sp. UG-2017b]|nr:uncharacterized protein UHOD_12035 [Ustilago sp. UG-2017b]
MVLLSALVLLLLPALLCHAAPMDPVAAASSSGALPEHIPGTQSLGYYTDGSFSLEPKRQSLTSDVLDDEHFGTLIHYDGTPVLFTEKDTEDKVKAALNSYGKVWLAGPHDETRKLSYVDLYKNEDGEFRPGKGARDKAREYVEEAKNFATQYSKKARHLRYGRPFAERKDPGLFGYKMLKIKKLRIGDYKLPGWKKIKKESTIYNLRETSLSDLRAHLDQKNYLKVRDDYGRLLGFALDKDGTVLFKDFSERVRL